jgi:hypothetical protein
LKPVIARRGHGRPKVDSAETTAKAVEQLLSSELTVETTIRGIRVFVTDFGAFCTVGEFSCAKIPDAGVELIDLQQIQAAG